LASSLYLLERWLERLVSLTPGNPVGLRMVRPLPRKTSKIEILGRDSCFFGIVKMKSEEEVSLDAAAIFRVDG